MKRALFLTTVILLVVGLAAAKALVTPITLADLKDLKGKWTGERLARVGGAQRTDLTLFNDSLPLEGEVTLYYYKDVPRTWPCRGRIENGHLLLFWDKQTRKMDLRLLKKDDGSLELEGDVTGMGFGARVLLKKAK